MIVQSEAPQLRERAEDLREAQQPHLAALVPSRDIHSLHLELFEAPREPHDGHDNGLAEEDEAKKKVKGKKKKSESKTNSSPVSFSLCLFLSLFSD